MPGSPAKFPTSRRRLEALWRPGWRLIGSYMITLLRKWMISLTGHGQTITLMTEIDNNFHSCRYGRDKMSEDVSILRKLNAELRFNI